MLDRVTAENLHRKIDEHVVEGSIVVTDDYYGYRKMPPVYDHKSIKHSAKKYVRQEGDFKVNQLCSFQTMPKAKPVQLPPIKFDDAMRKAMRVPPPPKKDKQRKVWRKKRR